MKVYKKDIVIEFNNSLFQVIIRKDNKKGFLKIIDDGTKISYKYPTAIEFLKLSSIVNVDNRIKF